MTAKSFKAQAERILREANPDASITICWQFARKVKWFDGTTGFSGRLEVAAPGFRTREMVASYSHGDLSVR